MDVFVTAEGLSFDYDPLKALSILEGPIREDDTINVELRKGSWTKKEFRLERCLNQPS